MSEPATASVRVEMFGRTDVGILRNANEDSFAIGDLDTPALLTGPEPAALAVGPRGPLLIVCDGMGGAAAGEVASALAVEAMWSEMQSAPLAADRAVYARFLRRAVRTANRRVWETAGQDPRLRGMGTTLSAAGLAGDCLILAQVGDSRAYILRGRTLTQVTRDQSIVSALLHAGRITEEEARGFAQANIILQALGANEDVDVALSIVELRRGDRLLLCSDGLHGPVPDQILQAALVDQPDLRAAVDTLIEHARAAGGPDNITAVLAAFSGDGLPAPSSEDDLPRFVEFDPRGDEARALTTTSRVARRLAARAGVTDDPGPPPIPATGQHVAVRDQVPPAPGDGPAGPASDALAQRSGIGLLAWVLAAVALVVVVAALFWWDWL